ncbi:MFS transporter [Paenibacillus oleatilyticus]|uniref:MFS transporter n=1 Tax=Paenibacillus oleatilyticus TaxID=2594886 RepID=UPI001C1FED53|nr:MFS transporter [Paenibacillus oleatilyticus]MBU7317017.1 MFS transporter [Paenibacillus oleatilyticus]
MSTTNSIFDVKYRALTIGIILVLTTVAFEGLAITTIAPNLAQSLQGIHLYGWIFSAFLLSQIVGTTVMGQQIDKRGVFKSILASFGIFVLGIVIAAVSFNMHMLIVGRAFQGFGAGALITCVYTSVTLSYPDALRTKILAAFSMAFVLPSLIGPYVAGLIAAYISWRFVFWIVLPLIVLALSLTFRSFRNLQNLQAQLTSAPKDSSKEMHAIVLAIGTGLLLTGLGTISDWKGVVLSIVGGFVMIPSLRKLLPQGTFSVKRGLPATMASRGLYVACYFATESFVILALTEVKGFSEELAGLIVAAGALSWSAAAWLQSKLDERDRGHGRKSRVILGIGIMIVGVTLVITAIVYSGGGVSLVLLSQIITGFGVGLANPTTGAIALQQAQAGKEGEISATLQFVDSFSIGLSIGVSGALIALSETLQWGIFTGVMMALALQLGFVLLSLVISFRITTRVQESPHPLNETETKLPM